MAASPAATTPIAVRIPIAGMMTAAVPMIAPAASVASIILVVFSVFILVSFLLMRTLYGI